MMCRSKRDASRKMITLFNEEQKKEGVFWKWWGFTFFSLFSLLQVFLRASLVFAWHLFCTFFPFLSLSILFGNHIIRIIALYFLSLVFIHDTLYINTHHTHTHTHTL